MNDKLTSTTETYIEVAPIPSNNIISLQTLSFISVVGLAHIITGLTIFVNPKGLFVTPLSLFHRIVDYLGLSYQISASILIFVGLLAIGGSIQALFLANRISIVYFLPQQFLLLLQIFSIAFYVFVGRYPDGYVPDGTHWFILTDQIWAWILPAAHTLWLWLLIYQHPPIYRKQTKIQNPTEISK